MFYCNANHRQSLFCFDIGLASHGLVAVHGALSIRAEDCLDDVNRVTLFYSSFIVNKKYREALYTYT